MIDNLARFRHRVWNFNVSNRREWVAEQASRLPAGSRILDVGAGPGQYRELFAHCKYFTQDFGQEPGTIGNYTQLDYQSDITAIPVESESFDAILCTEVLEHVPDPVAAVREIARILRPGGVFFATAPLGSFLHQEPYQFYGGYTSYWYQKFLPEAGLEIEEIVANKGFFSLYGQESSRFVTLLRSPVVKKLPFHRRVIVALLRISAMPFARLLPLIGYWLDQLELEEMATVGYHVIARKKIDA